MESFFQGQETDMKCICCDERFLSLSNLMEHIRKRHTNIEILSAIQKSHHTDIKQDFPGWNASTGDNLPSKPY